MVISVWHIEEWKTGHQWVWSSRTADASDTTDTVLTGAVQRPAAQSSKHWVSLRFNLNTSCWDLSSCLMQTRTHKIFTQATAPFWTYAQLWLKWEKATYTRRNDWLTPGRPRAEGSQGNERQSPFSSLPGKNVAELAVPQPALEIRVTLQGAAGGLFTDIYFNLSCFEFSLFERLVCVCGKGGLQLVGAPAPAGAQQRLVSSSWNISPDSGCHSKLLTDFADKSSRW